MRRTANRCSCCAISDSWLLIFGEAQASPFLFEDIMKKRILLCNEASFLGTGFARYGNEILKRLYETGKYELAELGISARPDDPRQSTLPWKFYGNNPVSNEDVGAFLSKKSNVYGEWRFEPTVIDFKPHIVWDIRDWWMMEFAERSPARPYFHWAIMPTVDSHPQTDYWLATFMKANGVLTYSEWGAELLRKETNDKIKVFGVASPAADYSVFKPVENKQGFKSKMGLSPNSIVFGTVMRNQRRKLYPELIETFAKFLSSAPDYIAKNIYLYLHCSWPDKRGWDIPRLLKDNGVGHRVFFTYVCNKCKGVFPSLFQDARTFCRSCGSYEAMMPNTLQPMPVDALAQIYNLFDVYIQYSSSEGFGIPQVEAAGCGVPVIGVNYSAMTEVIKNVCGTLIPVQRMVREVETHCLKAFPENDCLLSAFKRFCGMSSMNRRNEGFRARACAMKKYTWDNAARVWENYFDLVDIVDKWGFPAKIHKPSLNIPQGLSNDDFVRWCMTNIAGRPDLAYSFITSSLIQNLNFGYVVVPVEGIAGSNESEFEKHKYTKEMLVNQFLRACEYSNAFEQLRTGGKNVS
jgi:glycosyltransferase involved in cell wall biosynthesis